MSTTPTIPTQKTSNTGIVMTYKAATASGDTFLNTGREALRVKNGGASAITVTITAQNPCDQGTLHNLTISVSAGAEETIGPLRVDRYNDANGYANVGYSAATSVTVAVEKVSI